MIWTHKTSVTYIKTAWFLLLDVVQVQVDFERNLPLPKLLPQLVVEHVLVDGILGLLFLLELLSAAELLV